MNRSLTIGQLARASGCSVQSVRHYEAIGLLRAAGRSAGNQRQFGDEDARRLGFIRHARELGFSIEEIRSLIRMASRPDQSCEEIDAIVRTHLAAVTARIGALEALKCELSRMLEHGEHGRVGECRILEVLADHSHRHCLVTSHADTDIERRPGAPHPGRSLRKVNRDP